ncbi:MAG: MerR family transcriptional regulator [Micavibrio aeruginosavorus]|uniref:MerR family transcriptional regulator n=1 Tax=Micavibrio aeruginosavorus TaxID=349221 RepID=A0A2W5MTI8_9BACT|nr:MAG: MerR family transcriptional regulator [Micavibrio aeruginosavorus]
MSSDPKGAKKAQGAFRTISEVADELDVPQHVLRFWETKFSQVKPLKRGGGRRYYRPEDVALLKHIHFLLYTEGYTIKGVQKLLKGQGKNQIAAQAMAAEEAVATPAVEQKVVAETPRAQVEGKITFDKPAKVYNLSDRQRSALEEMLDELKELRAMLPQQA